jgi:hypothetical protein
LGHKLNASSASKCIQRCSTYALILTGSRAGFGSWGVLLQK